MFFKKKIYVSVEGGIGNQIFMWLAAKNLAKKNNSELNYETFSGFIIGLKNSYNRKYKRYSKLEFFQNIKKNKSNFVIAFFFLILRIINFVFRLKLYFTINLYFIKITVFNDLRQNFNITKFLEYKQRQNEIIFLIGYWQHMSFIQPSKKDALYLEKKLENKIQKFYLENIKQNTVALHIRGGERLNKKVKKIHPIPDLNYYKNAVNHFKNKKTIFHIFTDDKKFALKILNKLRLKKYLYVDKYFKNDYEQFVLLTKYKNYILTNSTFSMLPSLLFIENKNKIFFPNLYSIKKNFPLDFKIKKIKFI